jgi:hypothetical protein
MNRRTLIVWKDLTGAQNFILHQLRFRFLWSDRSHDTFSIINAFEVLQIKDSQIENTLSKMNFQEKSNPFRKLIEVPNYVRRTLKINQREFMYIERGVHVNWKKLKKQKVGALNKPYSHIAHTFHMKFCFYRWEKVDKDKLNMYKQEHVNAFKNKNKITKSTSDKLLKSHVSPN